jgi:hypothetical protein
VDQATVPMPKLASSASTEAQKRRDARAAKRHPH